MPQKGKTKNGSFRSESGPITSVKRVTKEKAQGIPDKRATSSGSNTPPNPLNEASEVVKVRIDGLDVQNVSKERQELDGVDLQKDPQLSPIDNGREYNSTDGSTRYGTEREVVRLKSLDTSSKPSWSHTATVIKIRSLRDAIAILILLLSLSPIMVVTIQVLFATMMLLPASSTNSWPSPLIFPPLSEWFHATPGGGPSPFTVLVSDIVTTSICLICPGSFRAVLMDLVQAVIAITLSGAVTSGDDSTGTVATCTSIVFMFNLSKFEPLNFLNNDRLDMLSSSLGVDLLEKFPFLNRGPAPNTTYNWPRLLLGCHILAQGALSLLRQWFSIVNQKSASNIDGPISANNTTTSETFINNGGGEVARTAVSPTSTRTFRDQLNNFKRRRKRIDQVKIHQPLWSAVASTKVNFTVLKNVQDELAIKDLTDASDEVVVDLHTGLDLTRLVPKVWITNIGSTEVDFDVSIREMDDFVGKSIAVRVNGVDWTSTRLPIFNPDINIQKQIQSGNIQGLSPSIIYTFDFVITPDQEIIYSVTVKTVQGIKSDVMDVPLIRRNTTVSDRSPIALVSPSSSQATSRPLSPVSTLKHSISIVETKRDDISNRLKMARRDNKSTATTVRRDADSIKHKLNTSGKDDDKTKQRLLQLRQMMKQADDAHDSTIIEKSTVLKQSQAENVEASSRQAEFTKAKSIRVEASNRLDRTSNDNDSLINNLRAEHNNIYSKREKLIVRRNKLHENHDRLKTAQNEDASEKHRLQVQQETDRALMVQKAQERFKAEELRRYWISATKTNIENNKLRSEHYYERYRQVEQDVQNLQPLTPEGLLPGTNPFSNGLNQFSQPLTFNIPLSGNYSGNSMQQNWTHNRRRSGSLVSQASSDYSIALEAPTTITNGSHS